MSSLPTSAFPIASHALPLTVAAVLLEGPEGIVLYVRGDDGRLTQLPITHDALRDMAALATGTLTRPAAH